MPKSEPAWTRLDSKCTQAYGGLDGRPWDQEAERWIYRAIKRL